MILHVGFRGAVLGEAVQQAGWPVALWSSWPLGTDEVNEEHISDVQSPSFIYFSGRWQGMAG